MSLAILCFAKKDLYSSVLSLRVRGPKLPSSSVFIDDPYGKTEAAEPRDPRCMYGTQKGGEGTHRMTFKHTQPLLEVTGLL